MKNFLRFLPLLITVSASAQTADAIIAREVQTSRAYETLSHITDDIGARLTGSKGAAKAVAWTTQQFREWGIPVTNEPVMVPHWVRGREEARLISPADHNIVLTAIGGSVPTPEAGITAEVIEVDSFDELKTLGAAKLRGKIVFYNNPMDMELVRTHRAFEAYRIAVAFRGAGPSRPCRSLGFKSPNQYRSPFSSECYGASGEVAWADRGRYAWIRTRLSIFWHLMPSILHLIYLASLDPSVFASAPRSLRS